MEGSEEKSERHKPRQQCSVVADAESGMNLALTDPPRWGWTAAGTIADLLPPHERSRRRSTAMAYRKLKRKRTSSAAASRSVKGDVPTPPASMLKAIPESSTAAAAAAEVTTPPASTGETVAPVQVKPKDVESSSSSTSNTADTVKAAPPHPPSSAVNDETPLSMAGGEDSVLSQGLQEQHQQRMPPPASVPPPETAKDDSSEHPTTQQQTQKEAETSSSPTDSAAATEAPQKKTSVASIIPPKTPPTLPPPLATGKLLGVKRSLVGMDVKKVDGSENSDKRKKSGKKGGSRGRSTYECRVDALSKAGVLDMYSYHRGREGYEPRDPETGELRCPLEASDTNCSYDAPRLSFNVTIEFPLHDGPVDHGSTNDEDLPLYSETITWDLSDPSTPSPLIVATNIANDFGLRYGQMMDLALSIQSQIDAYTQQNLSYWTPISVMDPAGIERQYVGSSIQTHRFGHVLQTVPGGTRLAPKERQRVASGGGGGGGGRSASRASSVNGSTASGRRRSISSKVDVDYADEDIDEEYTKEVKRRSRAESILDITKKCQNGLVGLMERVEDGPCHICRKRCEISFVFACGLAPHCYCENHCKSRLGDTFNPEQPVSSFCPMCALLCTCAKCVRRVKTVAAGLKHAMELQGTTLEETRYDDLLSKCRTLTNIKPTASSTSNLSGGKRRHSEINVDLDEVIITPPKPSNNGTGTSTAKHHAHRQKQRASTGRAENRTRLLVSKPPLSEFPREIYGTLELEPGTPEDYLRVYTSTGTYISDDFPEVWSEQQDKTVDSDSVPTSNGEIVEDGNVDFCQICRNHGNLVCCDYCPRAFHLNCLGIAASQDRWECITCKKEKEGLPDDLVDTKQFIDLMCASFADVKVGDDNGSKEMEALSGIHAMLSKLLTYDFGYMFSAPVDVETVPGYKDTVKNPMDLGTVCTKLTSGGYADIVKNGGTFDDVLVAVLRDIELVWHNCFLFNFDGSAIYRMAAVQRRRALAIQKKSFDHLLSDKVKSAVSDYVKSCEVMRGQLSSALPIDASPTANAKEKEKALRSRKPKGKHKITVKVAKPTVNRPIAIFDSATGRIVKIYSSMKSAGHAASSMIELGHRCEWLQTQDMVKTVVNRAASDPSVLLFGYRWIWLEDLRAGRVSFHQPSFEGIQVRDRDNTFTYLSLDEATSFPLLDKSQSVEQIRRHLSNLEPGCGWTLVGGKMWRRLAPPGQGKPSEQLPAPGDKQLKVLEEKTEDVPLLGKKFLAQSAVIKEDLISKRKLVGFETVEAALQDWIQAAVFSPSFPPLEAKTMKNFTEYYLDGERNIDGLVWRSQKLTPAEPITTMKSKGIPAPVPAINGVAPSPLVRSADKRSRGSQAGKANGDQETTRKPNDEACFSSKISSLQDGQNNHGIPLTGIQLFKHPDESNQVTTHQNGE